MTTIQDDPPNTPIPEGLSLRTFTYAGDLEHVGRLVKASGFFSPDEQGIAIELVKEHLDRGAASGYEFVFVDRGPQVIGYACYGPIPCTLNSFDLYWIVVDPQCQRQGLGRLLLGHVEHEIAGRGGQRIYVDTSSRRQYDPTRRFYERMGYARAALLEDFYATGDSKVVYAKILPADGRVARMN